MPSGKSSLITSLNLPIDFLTELEDTFLLVQSTWKTNKKHDSPMIFQPNSKYFFRQLYLLKHFVH